MQYNPNPFASSSFDQQSQQNRQQQNQFIQQERSKQISSGILFLDSRSSNCQHFYTIWQQTMGQNSAFIVIDVAKEPHKFTPTIRRNSGGQLPVVVVRGINSILSGNQAFQWLSQQQKIAHAQSMSGQGMGGQGMSGQRMGQENGGVPCGVPEGFSRDNPLTSGMPAGQTISEVTNPQSMAAAQSSLDAMYGSMFNDQEKRRLEMEAENKKSQGGSSMSYTPIPVSQSPGQQGGQPPNFQQFQQQHGMGQNTRQKISNNELDNYLQRREAACPNVGGGQMPF